MKKGTYGEKRKITCQHSDNVPSAHRDWIVELLVLSEPFENEHVV